MSREILLTHGVKTRLPPGQHSVTGFPRLDLGVVPRFDPMSWDLRVGGAVNSNLRFTFDDIGKLPSVVLVSDFHCVTGWSKLDVRWTGVLFSTIARMAEPQPSANFVMFECDDGYTTSHSLSDLMKNDVILAYEFEEKPIPLEHGGPLRLLVPFKYAYKSAKWVRGIRFTEVKELGYWEMRGYSDTADPWTEDRYSEF